MNAIKNPCADGAAHDGKRCECAKRLARADVCWSSILATSAAHVVIMRAQQYAASLDKTRADEIEAREQLLEAVRQLDEINHAVRKANGEL